MIEGTDYTIGEYTNNVEVTTENAKAQVEIIGMGAYGGTATGEFDISYLELDESWITVSGQEGNNGCYVSDVSIEAAEGYELVVDGEAARIAFSTDGEHSVTFRVRRLSDGAMTDLVTRTVTIDKTAPTGTITLDATGWSTFLEFITFGLYKVDDLAATVTAEDANGIAGVEYVITEEAYASVTELEAAGLTWESYSEIWKPTLKENKNQIIYVRITDMAGNVSYISSDGIHVDTLAPEVAVTITGTTSSSVSFTITSSEAGTYYYTVLKATDEIPTAEQVKLGHSGTAAPEGVALTAGGLEKNVAYVIYAVAEDEVFKLSTGESAPNTSAVAFSNPVTTDRVNLGDEDADVQIQVDDALYTGAEVKPAVKVLLNGGELVEGVDYEVTYHENVEVSSDKPYVRVVGINGYAGVLTANFAIRYLPLDESLISISGTLGRNDYYVSAVTVGAKDGYELVPVADSQLQFHEDGTHETRFQIRRLSDGAMTDVYTLGIKVDMTAPEGTVTVGSNAWSEFLNTITFGLFFKETQTVTITASDQVSDIQEIRFYLSDSALSLEQVKALGDQWSVYENAFSIEPDSKCVVYAMITDNAGHITYRSSDGLIVESTPPAILGVTDGGTYYGDQTITVTDAYLDSVTLDGETIELTDNTFVLPADNAQHIIRATDQAGNECVCTITVYRIYTVRFVADGSVIGTVPVNHGGSLSADQFPEIPAKDGYDQTPPRWDSDSLTDVREDTTVTAIYMPNVYRILVPETQTGYTLRLSADSVTLGDSYTFTLEIAEGYSGAQMVVTVNGTEIKPIDGVYTVENVTCDQKIEVTGVVDVAAPTAAVSVGGNTWKEFLNTITFGLFFKETQEAKITAEDIGSGLSGIWYLVTENAMTLEELENAQWTAYTKPVSLDADGNYVVYAKAQDKAGNLCYVSSDGLVIDMSAPTVSGIVDGGVYTGEVTFTVSDANIDTITINGEKVSGSEFTLLPAEGLQTVVVTDKAGNTVTLTVTVESDVCHGGEGCPSAAYADLDHEAWYHPYTDYVIENGLMQGYSSTIFAPCDNLSRAMMVQVLYNLEGRPAVSGEKPYTDVPKGTWFFDAILWASEEGLVLGYGNGAFGPDDPITREQMAVIFYRYSQARGYSLSEGSYDHFKDHGDISGYAQQAMRWAVGNDLLIGSADNRLHPRDYTTRVEFAAMLQRFLETFAT